MLEFMSLTEKQEPAILNIARSMPMRLLFMSCCIAVPLLCYKRSVSQFHITHTHYCEDAIICSCVIHRIVKVFAVLTLL